MIPLLSLMRFDHYIESYHTVQMDEYNCLEEPFHSIIVPPSFN